MNEEKVETLETRLEKIKRDMPPPYTGKLVGNDQIIVFDYNQASSLYANGFYGKPIGIKKPDPTLAFERELQVNLLEAYYLIKKGWLIVVNFHTGDEYTSDEIYALAGTIHKNFKEKSLVYDDLREKGYVVRPGLKFGADFTVYKQGPGIDHSSFVVQVLEHENQISAMDMVRAGRLATSVKKRFVLASISSEDSTLPQIVYYIFKWFKP
ncbi:MAG: tRNA-intron lyase [Promethearchaeota archaeon]